MMDHSAVKYMHDHSFYADLHDYIYIQECYSICN